VGSEGDAWAVGSAEDNDVYLWDVDAQAWRNIGSLQGPPGPAGPAGKDGEGVPTGGAAGQVLAKKTASDYDTQWVDPPEGGSAITSPNNSWVRYFSGDIGPANGSSLILTRAEYPTLEHAAVNDNIFILYGYYPSEEESGGEDTGTEEGTEEEGVMKTAGSSGEALPDEGEEEAPGEGAEEIPDGGEEVDVYDYFVCAGQVKTVRAEDVELVLTSVAPFNAGSATAAPGCNVFTIGNHPEDPIVVPDALGGGNPVGLDITGNFYLMGLPWNVFGLETVHVAAGAPPKLVPKSGDRFVGYLWLTNITDAGANPPYKYFVTGEIQAASAEEDTGMGYPNTYDIWIQSGKLVEQYDESDAPPAEEPLTVEEVVSNGWRIRKYSDGYVEMFMSMVFNTVIDTKVADRLFVSSATFDDPFPIKLTALYNCSVTIGGNGITCFPMCALSDDPLTRTIKWRAMTYANGATTPSVTRRYHVTGRWK
jgi:hypothetical protein